MYILGISCFYHDSAAALLKDGVFVAACEEERFSRKKHDHSFPRNAIQYCLDHAGININEVDYVVFHEKPFVKFERIIQTALATFPLGFWTWVKAIPSWLSEKLWVESVIKKELKYKGEVLFSEHHLSHAASAYLLSPFESSAILTVDGVGEWTTTMKGFGRGREMHMTHELHFPHSLGLLYSTFTAYLGFEVNEGEYKVMGMAPYGEPKYVEKIMKLLDVKEDGSFHMDMSYFAFHRSFQSFSGKFVKEFGPARKPEAEFSLDPNSEHYVSSKHYADIAASIQLVLEEIELKMVRHLYEEAKHNLGHPTENLCMAGGVALNCTANGRIIRETPFKNIFIPPPAGDSGGALGAAVYVYHTVLKRDPRPRFETVYLGPDFDEIDIGQFLQKNLIKHEKFETDKLLKKVAQGLANDKVIGWFQGRMEIGPRALGNRSILANPKNPKMKDILNEKIKHREKFRPFAPSVIHEHAKNYFNIENESPYMLFITNVHPDKHSEIPAVTHQNGTARVQTVRRDQNPRYYDLLAEFHSLTGIPVLINTSFNVRGEPIVCTPEQAFNCFKNTDMDVLVLGDFLIEKERPI